MLAACRQNFELRPHSNKCLLTDATHPCSFRSYQCRPESGNTGGGTDRLTYAPLPWHATVCCHCTLHMQCLGVLLTHRMLPQQNPTHRVASTASHTQHGATAKHCMQPRCRCCPAHVACCHHQAYMHHVDRCCHAYTARCHCKACCQCKACTNHVASAHPEEASARQSMAENSASSSLTSSSKVAVAGSSMRTEPS